MSTFQLFRQLQVQSTGQVVQDWLVTLDVLYLFLKEGPVLSNCPEICSFQDASNFILKIQLFLRSIYEALIWHTAVSPLLRLFYATVIPSSCEFFALSFKIFRTGHFLRVLSGIRCIRQSTMVWNKLCSSYRKWYAELYAISGMVVKVIKDIWRKRNRHPSNPSTEFTSFSFFYVTVSSFPQTWLIPKWNGR